MAKLVLLIKICVFAAIEVTDEKKMLISGYHLMTLPLALSTSQRCYSLPCMVLKEGVLGQMSPGTNVVLI